MYTRSFEMLFYTYTVIWLIVFVYLMFLSYRAGRLEKRIKELENSLEQ